MHLHIVINSPVFTQSVLQRIYASGQQETIILVTKSYKTIDVYLNGKKSSTKSINQVSQWLSTLSIETLTAHFLSTLAAYLILRLQDVTTVKWVVWGGDYYDQPKIRMKYKGVDQVFKTLSMKDKIGYQVINRALRKIDCVIGNLCDLNEIENNLKLNVKYKQLNHFWDYSRFGKLDPSLNSGKVLVGNSDDQSNNHLTCVKLLQKFDTDKHLILPLSGVSNSYTQLLKQTITTQYGSQEITYLDTFLEESDYQKQLSECSHLVYGHYRQQGMATLFTFLRSGRVCYLQSTNPYYKYLISLGCTLYAIDQAETWTETLTPDEQRWNKKLINTLLEPELIGKQWDSALSYGNISE